MTLISALLGMALEHLFTHLHELRSYAWFRSYTEWFYHRWGSGFTDQIAGALLILFPIWMSVGLIQFWLEGWLLGIIELLFYVVVFVYCLGPRDLSLDVANWCEICESPDEEQRDLAGHRLLKESPPADSRECSNRLAGAVLVQANDRLFGVLLWFVLLGPVGVVMYRSVSLMVEYRQVDQAPSSGLERLYALFVWLPARLVALGYALSGHFESAMEGWRKAHRENPQGVAGSEQVITLTGIGALGLSSESQNDAQKPILASLSLVRRTLIIWLVALSVMTLAGWSI